MDPEGPEGLEDNDVYPDIQENTDGTIQPDGL